MSSIICTILICLIVWVQIARGDGSRYGIGTLNDDFAPDEVKAIIKNVKLEKQLDGYKLLSILKKKYGFENYSIITMKDHSINEPKAHTKFDYKFSANTYFQENMTIRIYQDCIHEIQHAKDRMLIIKYYLFLCISFLITISAFILSKSLLLSIAVCFLIDVIRRAIIIERNAIQFAVVLHRNQSVEFKNY